MKIRIVVLILFGSFASTAFSQSGNPLNNWSEFLGTNMARYNPYETTLGVSNVPGLQMKWACPIGTDEISSPVVAGGVVYLQASYEDSASVVALKNGSVLWSFNEGIDTWGGLAPAVANGAVYVSGGQEYVFALDATTGALLWDNNEFAYVQTAPVVAGNLVYFGGAFGGGLTALDAGTGVQAWSFDPPGGVGSSPAVVDNVVYAGGGEGVYAVNATTGIELWRYQIRSGGNTPAVANDVVYAGSNDNNVYALNATTGAKLWSYATGGSVQSAPAVANGVVYAGSGDANLYALNATTGALLWTYTASGSVSSPAVANGVVYFGGGTGTGIAGNNYGTNLYAANATTGALLWSYIPDTQSAQGGGYSPAVADGEVYFGSNYGHSVVAFGLN